ncbi:unnamed protein product [Rangifer tarandus platyrhynchus]|uniref:Uncharacterized protein n=2 Tax=Rangifer tarandus platyrhynchus TaxID=3082113 RepID=A0ABN8YRY9_RANTA|nr:unnamed protein product [Rangifer tarandus platyrhynchus]CAI9701671.1 unnamed protein product [Rangifer tarandus platyrhynchus]
MSEFITAGCAGTAHIKSQQLEGSLISSSVPFPVAPSLLPRKFLLLPPLISGENSNERPPGRSSHPAVCRRGGAQARTHSQFPEEQRDRSPCPQPHKVRLSFQEQLTPQETCARTLSAASLGSVPAANRSNSQQPQNGYSVMCPNDDTVFTM